MTFTFETVQRTEDLNLQVDKIEPRKREEYCRAMLDALASKSSMKSDWVKHRLTEGDTVYLDLKNHRHVWSKPRQVRSLKHNLCDMHLECNQSFLCSHLLFTFWNSKS